MNLNTDLKVVILDKIARRPLKEDAAKAMKAAKPSAALVTLAVMAILVILDVLRFGVAGFFPVFRDMFAAAQSDLNEAVSVLRDFMTSDDGGARAMAGSFIGLILQFLGMVIGTGYSLYILRILRGEKAGVGDVFDAFGLFLRAIVLNILRSFLLSVWMMIYMVPAMYLASEYPGQYWMQIASLVLLLPAVRAAYAYSQAEYIMLDNRRLSAMQCILMSKLVMMGRKWELFLLDLSLLGRLVLCMIPVVHLWQLPYVQLTRAGYYRKAVNDFRVRQKAMQTGQSSEDNETEGNETEEDDR